MTVLTGSIAQVSNQNVVVVFVNESSGLIRGWASTTLALASQYPVSAGEVAVLVSREPVSEVDLYCNPINGDMKSTPF